MIIGVWVITIGVNSIVISVIQFQYVRQLGRCYPLSGFPFAFLLKAFTNLTGTVGIIGINVYLYKKILESNKRHDKT